MRDNHKLVLEHIRLAVARGGAVPGATELAAAFGWTRNKAMEALTNLTAEGHLVREWSVRGPGEKAAKYVYRLKETTPCN